MRVYHVEYDDWNNNKKKQASMASSEKDQTVTQDRN
jgi:hypothetical protein